MEQLMQPGLIGVVIALSVASTMTSVIPDRDPLRTAVYVLALKSEIGDLGKETHLRKLEVPPVELVQDRSRVEDADENQWLRKTRSEPLSATWKHDLENGPCTHMAPWVQALIQSSVDRGSKKPYGRAAFIKRATPSLPLSNDVRNGAQMEKTENLGESSSVGHRAWCVPICPVQASLLPVPPEPRLLPSKVQISECACDETRCSGRYQCLQAVTPVFTVRLISKDLNYCVEWIPAGCRCVPVSVQKAPTFEPFYAAT